MTIPAYMESGAIIIDAAGCRYRVMQSDNCDAWGNPKVWLQDMDSTTDGAGCKMEYSVDQIRKMGYEMMGKDGE